MRFSLLLIVSLAASFLVLAMGALAVACTDSSVIVGISPITGIQVRSDVIIAGKGCGTGPTQVYKYVAVVTDQDGVVRAAATYDCFSDGLFQSLPHADSGLYNFDFSVDVYAFNAADFNGEAAPHLGCDGLPAGGTIALGDVVGGVLNCPTSRYWTGQNLNFTWSTSCTTTQQPGVEVVAVCEPLHSPGTDGFLVLPTDVFPKQGGGTYACGPDPANPAQYVSVQASLRPGAAPPPPQGDAGSDAQAADAAHDASDAGDADAGADAGDSGETGPPGTRVLAAACPSPITFNRLATPSDHVVDVELFSVPDDAGAVTTIGRATCRGTTSSPFGLVTATCEPAP